MIRERIFEVIYHRLAKHGAISKLSEESGIARTSWHSVANKKQRATEEMIEFVCRKWPEFAYYIATGATDAANAQFVNSMHVSPELEKQADEEIDFYGMLGTEPIDWTEDETDWARLNYKDPKNIGSMGEHYDDYWLIIYIMLEAKDRGQLLDKILSEYEKKLLIQPAVKIGSEMVNADDFKLAKEQITAYRSYKKEKLRVYR